MGLGRNDPCRCGSGKKYKKCCGLITSLPQFKLSASSKASIASLVREAMLHQKSGQFERAEAVCWNILQIEPGNAEAFHFLGLIAAQIGKYENAIKFISKAITLKPGESGFHYNLAKAFKAQNDIDNAIRCYRNALKLKPDYLDANLNLGNTLKERGEFDEAVACYKEVLAHAPHDGDALYNLGNVFAVQNKLEEAADCFRTALVCKPGFAEAITNLGNIHKDQGNVLEAINYYRQAIMYSPEHLPAHHNLLYALNFDKIETFDEVADEHKKFGLLFKNKAMSEFMFPTPEVKRRVRIGYVSPDFRAHSCAYFFEPLLATHDRTQFEIFCYSDVKNSDTTTARIKSLSEHWRPTLGMKDDALLELIKCDQIDILVDLAGHTDGNRLSVFAARAAPIQVTWLGYPNTSGLTTMDYRLTDSQTDPYEITDHLYTEQLVRLPVSFLCYQPPSNSPPVSNAPFESNGYITFGCFNNATKITPSVVSVWAEILITTPNAKLLFKSKQFQDHATRQRYLEMFKSNGVAPDRVELIGQLPLQQDHLAAYDKVDIALDPFPYNGTTTTCEALWMGVPVISLAGEVHAGRVGVSLLHMVGLDDLVAHTPQEYVTKAVELAHDQTRISRMREGLRATFLASPLCDGKRFAQDMEFALVNLMG